MSQEKVDKYKEYKANKAKILKKQKTMRRIELGVGVLIAAALIGWIGYSLVTDDSNAATATVTEMDATAIDDFVSSLSAE